MGGYVTQSRRALTGNTLYSWYNNGLATKVNENIHDRVTSYVSYPQQVTTSYRSSGSEIRDDVDTNVATLGGTIGALRSQAGLRSTRYDNGHPFDTVVEEIEFPTHRRVELVGANAGIHYEGPLYVDPRHHSISRDTYPSNSISSNDMTYWGTRFIRDTTPTNSPANLAQALLELYREGLPRLFGASSLAERSNIARAAGSEYLNHQFGWIPLVNDVRDVATAVARSSELLRQYQQGSGKMIRRRRSLPSQKTATIVAPAMGKDVVKIPNTANFNGCFFNNVTSGTLLESYESEQKFWFSGAFTYYLQDADSVISRLHAFVDRANWLYGLELSPELLWELAPWSWLVDWIGNVGINISNATNLGLDGTVLRYGYVMCTVRSTHTTTLMGLRRRDGSSLGPITAIYRTIRKKRVRATPYGFALNPTNFTGRQWAILAALGMTRGNANTIRYND